MTTYHLYSDGNYFPRAKKSGFGGYIESPSGEVVVEYSEQIKDTNNSHSFEILGILRGLQFAKDLGIKNIVSHCDDKNTSLKLIEIFETKESTVEDTPKPELYQQVVDISQYFNKIQFKYIPRHLNKHADALSRKYSVLMEENYLRQFSKDLNKSERFFLDETNPQKRFFFSHPNMVRVEHKNNPFLIAQYRNKKVRKVSKEQQKNIYTFIFTEIFKNEENQCIFRNFLYDQSYKKFDLIENKFHSDDFFKSYCKNLSKIMDFANHNNLNNLWFSSNHRGLNNIFEQKEKCTKEQFEELLTIYKKMNHSDKIFFNNLPFNHKFSPELEKIEQSKQKLDEEISNIDDLMEQLSSSTLIRDRKKFFGEIVRHQLRSYKQILERELNEIEIKSIIKETDEAIKNYKPRPKF